MKKVYVEYACYNDADERAAIEYAKKFLPELSPTLVEILPSQPIEQGEEAGKLGHKILRDCCEAEVAHPDDPETISISRSDLIDIVCRHLNIVAAANVDEDDSDSGVFVTMQTCQRDANEIAATPKGAAK